MRPAGRRSAGGTYRIYFALPVRGAPRPDTAALDRIGAVIRRTRAGAELAGRALGTSTVMGDHLVIGRLVTDEHRAVPDHLPRAGGKVHADAFRAVLRAAS